jgi:molecular chaperone HscB
VEKASASDCPPCGTTPAKPPPRTERAGGFFLTRFRPLDHDNEPRMNLQSDDFELFGLLRGFAQDRSAIDARWKELQREAHPDKFAAQGATTQRAAMQWSVRINEAYQRLKDPMRRAAYLCELHGAPIRAEDNTAMPAAFLMQQMEWREALEEATTERELDALEDAVAQARRAALADCEALIDQHRDYAGAAQRVRALMFIARFAEDIERRREQLGQ